MSLRDNKNRWKKHFKIVVQDEDISFALWSDEARRIKARQERYIIIKEADLW